MSIDCRLENQSILVVQFISSIKTKSKSWEHLMLREARRAEAAYIEFPPEHSERGWLEAQSVVK